MLVGLGLAFVIDRVFVLIFFHTFIDEGRKLAGIIRLFKAEGLSAAFGRARRIIDGDINAEDRQRCKIGIHLKVDINRLEEWIVGINNPGIIGPDNRLATHGERANGRQIALWQIFLIHRHVHFIFNRHIRNLGAGHGFFDVLIALIAQLAHIAVLGRNVLQHVALDHLVQGLAHRIFNALNHLHVFGLAHIERAGIGVEMIRFRIVQIFADILSVVVVAPEIIVHIDGLRIGIEFICMPRAGNGDVGQARRKP